MHRNPKQTTKAVTATSFILINHAEQQRMVKISTLHRLHAIWAALMGKWKRLFRWGAIQWVDTLPWLQSSLDVGIKTMGPQRYPKHRFLCKSLWEINPQHSTQRHAVCTSPTACTPVYGVWKVRGASFQVPEIRSHNFGRGNSQWLSIELGATWCNCDLKDFEPNGKERQQPLAQPLTCRSTCLVGYIDQLAIVREDVSAKSGNEGPMLKC